MAGGLAALAALAALAVLVSVLGAGPANPLDTRPEAATPAQAQVSLGAPLAALAASASAATPLAPSLDGTTLDGDWGLDPQGQLQPSRALRWRFDHLLTQIGERDVATMRAQLVQLLRGMQAVPGTAQSVLDVWDRYVKLQQWPWKTAVDLRSPDSWRQSLAERQLVRRQILGLRWAEAFYGDEDRALLGWIQALDSGQTLPNTSPTPPPLPDAPQREAELAAQWQAWDQRLALSRKVLQGLRHAPEMSALQRQQAIAQHLDQHYSGSERLRAQALLSLETAIDPSLAAGVAGW
jgi:lipase chaperone LimK